MRISNIPANRRPKRFGFALTFIFVMAAALTLLAVGVIGFFRLSRDAQCLRNSLTAALESQEASWSKKLELSAGPLTFGAVRAGLSFVTMDAEARMAVAALRGAEVGVYSLSASSPLDRAAMLVAADEAMSARGWDRVVGVSQGRDLVMIYLARQPPASTQVRACIGVLHRDELIVVSTRGNLEPLMPLIDLALSQPDWTQPRRLSVRM